MRRKIVGNKNEVWQDLAHKTAGGLTKSDLTLNKRGKVVSKKQSEHGKRNHHRLKKHQFQGKSAAKGSDG